jgi:lipoprotein-releasing system ATP-binding protein
MAELIVEHVAKEFATRSEPLQVLRDVSLRLSAGENAVILGPSGSGKSTLLQIIGTLEAPSSGTVRLDGVNPFGLSEIDLAAFRNRQIGFIFQDHHLLPQLTAWENVLLPALAQGTPSDATTSRARELLERVGLAERLDHRPAELSGGERQRVAIARALLNSPSLLLADEPTGTLDRSNARQIANLLLELQSQRGHQTVLLVVTHSQDLAERFDTRFVLDDGRFVESSNRHATR